MRHLLVTNDYPPKVGGIQNYLWELWRRQPADEAVILTRPHPGGRAFDAKQDQQIVRSKQPLILPEPALGRKIKRLVAQESIDLVLFDPAIPAGMLGPRLGLPYGVILHGAEVTIPGRIPGSRQMLSEVLRKAELVVTAGVYSTNEAERAAGQELPVVVVPPGVDPTRFTPVTADQRRAARAKYGLTDHQPVVLGLSRLVPRKGLDTVIQAAAMLATRYPDLELLIAGSGRDRRRLERLATQNAAPVRFLGRVPEEDLPQLYAMSDVFTMLCRTRWRGLEQEGFGIVFLEAAAAGVPQIAGNSGGAAEAVQHGVTGFVVHDPTSATATAQHLGELLADPARAAAMGRAGRERAIEAFSYDTLAVTLRNAISATIDQLGQSANKPA